MEPDYDVIVIGAGPGGSTAARYAALHGAHVLMIEKRQEIGSPVRCGEGIAKRWLDRIGIEPSGRWIAKEVDGARIVSPGGYEIIVDESRAGNECGYVIHRDLFDQHLALEAARRGVEIEVKTSALDLLTKDGRVKGVRVMQMGHTSELSAHVVIGADGFESQVGRWAGIDTSLKPEDIDTCFQRTLVGIDVDSRFTHFYTGSIAPGGYAWIFPKGEDIANVGIGVQLSRVRGKGDAMRYLDAFISRHPWLAKGSSVRDVAGAVSTCTPLERTVGDGIILVGDAARQIDPITGGGVYNACIAGMHAGRVAAEAVELGDAGINFLQRYEKAWRSELEEKLYRNWMVKEKYSHLGDETLDRAVKVIAEAKIERMSTRNLLDALRKGAPDLVAEFEGFL
ncbi:MAG: NAD(P)/FAD-dependent oxidoreductase [Candidatus Thermoplasmatota archaeon]